jgi:CheY-like chemotaxis protein
MAEGSTINSEIPGHPSEKLLFGARILCVDDDPVAAELVRMTLAAEGAQVVVLTSAEDAILLLQSERYQASDVLQS